MLTGVLTACLACALAAPALAVPSAAQTARDRQEVAKAVAAYEAAEARAAKISARVAESSARLDELIAEENRVHDRLHDRVLVMYRAGEGDSLSLLMSSSTIQEFVARWDLLARIARQDAETLSELKKARTAAEESAGELMRLQADQARALDEVAQQVSSAKKELAASEAALEDYRARITTVSTRAAKRSTAPKADATQTRTGTGAWRTAVASHYGRNFTGRGANGEQIGPYSMMVAHKTLPFGTLVEIEYGGKRAVAKVADRGPYTKGREFDLGPGVVRALDFSGVHEIRYRIIGR